MIQIDVVSSLGNIGVETQTDRGQTPEFWAERLTDRICGISENAEGHVRQQAEAFKVAIYNTVLYYIQEAIKSDRCTMSNMLNNQGHENLAKIIKEL